MKRLTRQLTSVTLTAIIIFSFYSSIEAQQPKIHRIGVLVPGEAWYEIIDGLRVGLKQFGVEEG